MAENIEGKVEYSDEHRQRMWTAAWKTMMANSGGLAQDQDGFEDRVQRMVDVAIENGTTPEQMEAKSDEARSREIRRVFPEDRP